MSGVLELKKDLPPIIARLEVGRLTGGVIHPRTLANLDSLGEGPKSRFYVGRKACYLTEDFLEWLDTRISKEVTKN